MYLLVKFDDGKYFICPKSRVYNFKNNHCFVKYKNGARYPASVVRQDTDEHFLRKCLSRMAVSEEENNQSLDETFVTELNLESTTTESTAPLTLSLFSDSFLDECFGNDINNTDNLTAGTIEQADATDASVKESAMLDSPLLFSTPNETANLSQSIGGRSDLTFTINSKNKINCERLRGAESERETNISDIPGESFDVSDYVPSVDESEDLGKNDFEEETEVSKSRKRTSVQNVSLEVSLSINVPGRSTRDDSEMFVTPASKKKGLDRRSFCMYCQTMQTKFVRHLENKHMDVEEVKKFSCLPKKNLERLQIIETIRKRSMFDFNTNDAVNDGELMVCRRPNTKAPRTAKDYKVCQNCKGFFTKNNIRHHAKKCFGYNGTKSRTLLVYGRKILGRIHPLACELLREVILPVMREDDVVRLIRYDQLTILYGNKLCTLHGTLQHQHDLIRSQLRLLGRFLLALKAINNEVTDFASVYQPKFYDDTILAIHEIAAFDPKTRSFGSPSTAYAIGAALKKVAAFYITDCIKKEDVTKKLKTEDFQKLLIEDIAVSVNKGVTETQTLQKRRKKVELPSAKDIQTLHNYLKHQRSSACKALENAYDFSEWLKLAQSTLISLQLFNRRRAGEIERVSIEDFRNYEGVNEDELKRMNKENRQIANNYVRFTIRGKLNRTVPVLLTADLLRCVEKILQHREEANVQPSNKYVFGIPGTDKKRHSYLRACVLMRKFAIESGASFPQKLTGTTLRKHIATNCINLNLSENEVADVANFMGHADKIHRQHYRQPIVSRDILRMSKVLELAQVGDDDDKDDETESESEDEEDFPQRCRIEKMAELSNLPSKKKLSSNDSECEEFATAPSNKKLKRCSTKKRWTTEDKQTVMALFEIHFKSYTLPSLDQIKKICSKYPSLNARQPAVVKSWISNQFKKDKKEGSV